MLGLPIGFDNCSTKSISHDINDFIPDSLKITSDKAVSGFVSGSSTAIEQIGTISCNSLDAKGVARTIVLTLIMNLVVHLSCCLHSNGRKN
jgi:hypothetical protein